MRLDVDPTAAVPPSEQIANQIRFAVCSGRVAPGDRLPSVRGLAASARINPNTVFRAYRALEREGTVSTRPGAGVFVAPRARARCAAIRDRHLRSRFARVVSDALAAGLRPDEIGRLVTGLLESDPREVA